MGDRDLGVAFQTHPGRQAFISSGSKEPRSALESRKHLQCSAFFMVQLSHLYITTTKTIALTKRIFVGKVMSLLINRFATAFLSRSKCLLIPWLQSPSAVILEPKKIVLDSLFFMDKNSRVMILKL